MKKAKIFMIVQSAVLILTVLMLSAAAIGVYRNGVERKAEDPTAYIYTIDEVSEAASGGVKVLFIGLAITVIGWILGIRDDNADKPVKDIECMRDIAYSKVTTPSIEMMNERMLQDKLKKGGWFVFFVCMIPVVIYMINPAHFDQSSSEGLEHVIGSMVLHILPWLVIGFGFLISSAIQQGRCMEREYDAASIRIREEKEARITDVTEKKPGQITENRLNRIRCVIFVLAVIFIIAGIANGNMHAVMVKAINICTECVGLG